MSGMRFGEPQTLIRCKVTSEIETKDITSKLVERKKWRNKNIQSKRNKKQEGRDKETEWESEENA